MLRLLLVLCLATFTIPRTADAAVELRGATFSGQAFASIDFYAAPSCLDDKARGIYYQGPVSLEFNTRVQHPSCQPGLPFVVSFLNVRFSLVTLDSASIRIMDIEPETRRDILRIESIGYSSGRWPIPSSYSCYVSPDYYYGVRFPDSAANLTFASMNSPRMAMRFDLPLRRLTVPKNPQVAASR